MNPVIKVLAMLVCGFGFLSAPALAQDKPNILVIWGDDVGYDNISVYNLGMMGYQTPNINNSSWSTVPVIQASNVSTP